MKAAPPTHAACALPDGTRSNTGTHTGGPHQPCTVEPSISDRCTRASCHAASHITQADPPLNHAPKRTPKPHTRSRTCPALPVVPGRPPAATAAWPVSMPWFTASLRASILVASPPATHMCAKHITYAHSQTFISWVRQPRSYMSTRGITPLCTQQAAACKLHPPPTPMHTLYSTIRQRNVTKSVISHTRTCRRSRWHRGGVSDCRHCGCAHRRYRPRPRLCP